MVLLLLLCVVGVVGVVVVAVGVVVDVVGVVAGGVVVVVIGGVAVGVVVGTIPVLFGEQMAMCHMHCTHALYTRTMHDMSAYGGLCIALPLRCRTPTSQAHKCTARSVKHMST